MRDQQFTSILAFMNSLVDDFYAAKAESGIVAQHFVMVANDVDNACSAVCHFQYAPHDFIVRGRPMPAFAQLPPVDNVANQIECLALD